jgi:hypothetical protein
MRLVQAFLRHHLPMLFAYPQKRPEIFALAKPVGNPAHTGQRQAIVMRHLTQIIVAALGPASAILQKQIGHFPTLPSAESRTACGMRPAFRRGWEGEGKPKSMPWRGPAVAQATATRRCRFRFWEREGKALGVPAQTKKQRRSGAHREAQRITTTVPSHGATQAGDVSASRVRDKAVARSAAPPSKGARARRSSG